MNRPVAIVLAGSRPGGDPLAMAAGVPTKALVPIAGRPMLDHVVRTLVAHPRLAGVLILAQEPEVLTADPRCAWMAGAAGIRFAISAAGISQSLLDLLDRPDTQLPLLVTTADSVLLTGAMIDDFLAGAAGADIAVGVVERRVLLRRYPQSRRTWLKFRDGWWSGANLFWIGSPKARAPVAFWRGVEQDRKKGRKVLAAFGPFLLLASLLRILSIQQGMKLAGRQFGVAAKVVPLAQPEACIDADKPEDVALIKEIITRR